MSHHIPSVCQIFLINRFKSFSSLVTELLCIGSIFFLAVDPGGENEGWWLAIVGFTLCAIAHFLNLVADFFLLHDQHSKFEIINRIEADSEDDETLKNDSMFLHNNRMSTRKYKLIRLLVGTNWLKCTATYL